MKWRTIGILAGLAAVGVGAALWLRRPEPISVEVAEAARGSVAETVTNTRAGTVKACQRAKLAPPAGGQIARLPVKKGDRVQAGQVLLELWNADIRAELTVTERDAAPERASWAEGAGGSRRKPNTARHERPSRQTRRPFSSVSSEPPRQSCRRRSARGQ